MKLKTLLREPSTYRCLVWLLTAAGLALSPEQQTATPQAKADRGA